MPTYISLVNYTDQGIQNIKNAPKRIRDFRKLIASMGGKLKSVHLTMGSYDLVVISEAPDDETLTKATLTVAGQGNIRTTTMRAFDEAEMKRIVSSLP